MQKYGKEFVATGTYEEVPYADSVKGALSKLNAKLQVQSPSLASKYEHERTTQHQRFSILLNDASDNLPFGSELATRLSGQANAERMMAEARAEMVSVVCRMHALLIS